SGERVLESASGKSSGRNREKIASKIAEKLNTTSPGSIDSEKGNPNASSKPPSRHPRTTRRIGIAASTIMVRKIADHRIQSAVGRNGYSSARRRYMKAPQLFSLSKNPLLNLWKTTKK